MPKQDWFTDETRTRWYEEDEPICYWVDREGSHDVLRHMQCPIKFMNISSSQTFDGVVLFDVTVRKYKHQEFRNDLSYKDRGMTDEDLHRRNMKHVIQHIYKVFDANVLLVQYHPDSIQFDDRSDVRDLIQNFPMTPDFTMYWIHGHGEANWCRSKL